MQRIKNISVLYIDDDDCMRENVVAYLSYYFESVYEASDGLEGYERYQEFSPNIIVTDITMPRMNGLEMIEKIRLEDTETKIIIATAYLDNTYLLKAVELGLAKYLIKPISEDKLLPVLRTCAEDISAGNESFCIDTHHTFDMLSATLFKDEMPVLLTKKELDFLTLLVENSHRTVRYEELNSYVWQGEMSEDAMRTTVKGLRRKISKESLANISKVGYQIKQCQA